MFVFQKQNVQDMKRKLGFVSTEEVDRRIAFLEHSMMTSTLSLKEEKKLLDQIKQLKQNKPLIGKYAGLEASASSFEDTSVCKSGRKEKETLEEKESLRTQQE